MDMQYITDIRQFYVVFGGWSGRARVDNLALVVNNARFLILPEVRVYGLASFVLKAAVLRLGADWHQRYGDQAAVGLHLC